MKKILAGTTIGCIYLLVTTTAEAQYYFYNDKYYASDWVVEAGASFGLMNSLTDVGGRKGIGKGFIKDLNWKVTRPCFSICAIAMYKDAIGVRFEATSGSISSADHLLKNNEPDLGERYGRNLSFKSHIREIQLATEIHPLFLKWYDENESPFWSPYLVAGIGLFSFNPKALLNGYWYELYPLKLEGQGFKEYAHKPYQLIQPAVPVGAGIKYEAGASLYLRLEIIHRILFTDYIDDVSSTYINDNLFDHYLLPQQAIIAKQLHSRMKELQPGYEVSPGMRRGDARDNDAYFSIQFKVGWVIRKRR